MHFRTIALTGAAILALAACSNNADKSADEAPPADAAATDTSAMAPADGVTTAPPTESMTTPDTPMNPDGTPMNPPPTAPTDPGAPGTPHPLKG
jgi:hypothetical protein